MPAIKRPRRLVESFHWQRCSLNGPAQQPAFEAELNREQVDQFLQRLEACAASQDRSWYAVTSTYDNPTRIRLTSIRPPRYEQVAGAIYVRGDVFRVSCSKESFNLEFSSSGGASELAARLKAARDRMRRFLLIRVPNRQGKLNLLEFLPDTLLEELPSVDDERLAAVGSRLAGDLMEPEDFGDWEGWEQDEVSPG